MGNIRQCQTKWRCTEGSCWMVDQTIDRTMCQGTLAVTSAHRLEDKMDHQIE